MKKAWRWMAWMVWLVLAALAGSPASTAAAPQAKAAAGYDLAADEALGGHTLARHVGKTDQQLAARLRSEPQISAASTYTDRATAERAVGAAIAAEKSKLSAWENRRGRRPNLVLHYAEPSGKPLGRSLGRGQAKPVSASWATVVLRWDERRARYYVLTSYPERLR
jgi:hypothetical protein